MLVIKNRDFRFLRMKSKEFFSLRELNSKAAYLETKNIFNLY